MNIKPILLSKDDQTQVLNALGVSVTVLASKKTTQAGEVTLQQGAEGAGPPPHKHDWDESFYILSGSVDIQCEDVKRRCEAGTFVHVPAGTVHGFRFGEAGGSMLEFTSRGSCAVDLFTDLDQSFTDGPPDLEQAVRVLKNNGVEVVFDY